MQTVQCLDASLGHAFTCSVDSVTAHPPVQKSHFAGSVFADSLPRRAGSGTAGGRRLGSLDVMAKAPAPEKRPGFFSQISSLFRFTREEYPWLPWAQIAVLLFGIGIGLVIGYLIQPVTWWGVTLWGITGLMLGILAALFLMTRLSTKAMYKKIDGMPGATGHVLTTSLGRHWQAPDMPVGVNPKTQDAVFRAVGRGGIVIVGEGARGRLTRLINDEKTKAQRVAQGVPVNVFYVGHGDDEVEIAQLSKTIKKLPKAINKPTMAAVIKRLESVSQSLSSLPIPKGIDPLKARAQRPR